ncbi:class I SAM-dependent methyltransferase [Pararobbsia silviterrae]|uniref:Methyltransferase domain-containing protein n=1 Tax=Pararobbsia silviterrae TaxID=1792498 RepID=A0A494Y2K4_9BURK|nr:class I SAM-dependent methyltransferase [Pararobbsia silviterrae]RKP55683.1 methyltransferase domain-containing protein [Pararobbsia silviterrae]
MPIARQRPAAHTLVRMVAALAFAVASSLAIAQTIASDATPDEALDAAVNGPQRTEAFRARDTYRHPRETLEFFGVKPTDTVVEIAPGAGWYTEILAPFLRDRGTLYEVLYQSKDPALASEFAQDEQHFKAKLANHPATFDHVIVDTLHAGRIAGLAPGSADEVLTFRNIHNWIKDGQFDANLRAFYTALKPGGVFGVEEHRARPNTTLDQIIKTGYVPESYVIAHALAAGFKFDAQSDINANPRDTKDYADGVWSLPPTLKGGDKDRAKMLAIGESDRMTLRFIKPQ